MENYCLKIADTNIIVESRFLTSGKCLEDTLQPLILKDALRAGRCKLKLTPLLRERDVVEDNSFHSRR